MNRNKFKITHPTHGGVGEVYEEALPSWFAMGWVLQESVAPSAPEKSHKVNPLRGRTATTPVVNLSQESPGVDLEETI